MMASFILDSGSCRRIVHVAGGEIFAVCIFMTPTTNADHKPPSLRHILKCESRSVLLD